MKKMTKKLLVSVMLLMAAVALAATSTYAWFTMNDTLDVQSFDVNVTSIDGVYVSVENASGFDGTKATVGADGSFKAYVSTEEILNAIKAYNEGGFMKDGNLKKLTHGTVSGSTIVVPGTFPEERADQTSHYTFRLYFRSNSKYAIKLNIEDEESNVVSKVTSTSGGKEPVKAWKALEYEEDGASTKTTFAKGASLEADAANAVRIKFYNGTASKIWDPNAGKGFSDDVTGNVALDYFNHINGTTIAYSGAGAGNLDPADPLTNTLLTLAQSGDPATGPYQGYLDITIWLEGYDANALDSILADTIHTVLQFKGTVVA